jgi:hypothetical protein
LSVLSPGRFNPYRWIGDWVDARTGLDEAQKRKFFTLPGLELRLLSYIPVYIPNFLERGIGLSLGCYVCLCLYGSTALVDRCRFFTFLIPYTVGTTILGRDQPVARPLPAHRTTQTQNKANRQPCFERDLSTQFQCSSGRKRFIPQTARPL